ncbi:hypothetical protein ACLVWU_01225 [Bdellovibrio sp. HCB290]|uniref:hypothetical protein n=1 Tax=Bdellovibrio sp. HCB290 TaxID=3394356 RepID=UPI0039B3D4C7
MSEEQKPAFKRSAKTKIAILFLLALPVGITYMNNQFSSSRKIASTEQEAQLDTALASSDLSGSNPTEFQKAFKYQLLKNAKVTDFSDGMRLHLGHFFMSDETGAKISVCHRYPRIELSFSAEGMAVSGDVPRTTVRGSCRVAPDGLHLEGIVVDLPKQQDYQWVWTGIKLFSADKTETLEVSGYEIISVLGTPLNFSE